eukprot:UN18630
MIFVKGLLYWYLLFIIELAWYTILRGSSYFQTISVIP